MARRVVSALVIGALAIGCESSTSPLPELRYEGEHVRVGTDFDVPICRGTLDDFDREIERIEARLELNAEGKTALWILADDALYESFCPANTGDCAAWESAGGTLMRQNAPVTMWHALAHDRVNRAARKRIANSKGLFVEGMSEALARIYCEPSIAWTPTPAITDALLAEGSEHADFTLEGKTLASMLMRWLIETHGPDAVQDFMVAVDTRDSPDEVREVYSAYFGSSLDEDLYAHLDWNADARHPYEVGCRGEPPPSDEPGTWVLEANLDCDSHLVRSNWYEHRPERMGAGWVEWRLDVESEGYYQVVGDVPADTELTISQCVCEPGDWPSADPTGGGPFTGRLLTPGRYRIIWKGKLDSAALLDVRIVRS
jgi:hypothetical protein